MFNTKLSASDALRSAAIASDQSDKIKEEKKEALKVRTQKNTLAPYLTAALQK